MLGALLATAALLAACSADPPPLGTSGPHAGGICAPFGPAHPLSDGFYILHNSSTSPVTITSVKLAPSSHGLALIRAWLIPLYNSPRGGTDYAGAVHYPPSTWPTWPQRQAIPGAVVKSGQTLNLVIGLTLTSGRIGRTPGPVVNYTAGGSTYSLQENFGVAIVAFHTHCPSNM
jgi:hypothetical protein